MNSHLLIALIVTGVATGLLLCLGVLRWLAARNVEDALEDAAQEVGRRAELPELPEGHRPPPGLGPISPSERFLTNEMERGLRDLQAFLLDA